MADFRTIVTPTESLLKMGISDKIMTIGSCFADSIGDRMASSKMKTLSNPFGTLYNPISIHKALAYTINQQLPHPASYLQQGEIFLNYDFHSEISALSKEGLVNRITETVAHSRQFLLEARWLIITYGTAWVYKERATGNIVANCHKSPAAEFEKILLTTEDIEHSFDALYRTLKNINPKLNIILTVSPVRHLKDTLVLNSLSKSILRCASYYIAEKNDDVVYFPAYEIMIDDLRDYRFYKADLIHPNDVAEAYIWERFSEAYFKKDLLDFLGQWQEITRAINHKPFHAQTAAHKNFLRGILNMLNQVPSAVNVEKEIALVNEQLQPTDASAVTS
ncbi:MAG TPA: GSCFA domain-containing protein [Chryseolinea sp.]|nr:GSCFA domain-containing protein [Chryseolinea sp.]